MIYCFLAIIIGLGCRSPPLLSDVKHLFHRDISPLHCHIDTDVIHPPHDAPLIVGILGAEAAHFLSHLKVLNKNSSGMQSCLAAKVAAADKTLLSVSSV